MRKKPCPTPKERGKRLRFTALELTFQLTGGYAEEFKNEPEALRNSSPSEDVPQSRLPDVFRDFYQGCVEDKEMVGTASMVGKNGCVVFQV